jgi:hypothetical protein
MIMYVDIDDTICRSSKTNSDVLAIDYSHAMPIPERITKINKYYDEGARIIYWTARGTVTGKDWYHVTKRQLDSWGCKYHQLKMGKPAYDIFIDDKNINSDLFFADC